MPSMYQQNAINTYVKYVSIKMLHTYHTMQFVTILYHTIAYQQNITKYYALLCISKMLKTSMYQQNAKNTYAKYVSIKLFHTCYAMQSIAILCHIIAYQQIL